MIIPAKCRHMYLDLDRTLFDTHAFMVAVQRASEEVFGEYEVKATALHENYTDFRGRVDKQYYYQLFEHLAHYGIAKELAEERLRLVLKSVDFLYPDARDLLEFIHTQHLDAEILTFGEPLTQNFKYSFIPASHTLPLVSLLSSKGHYIKSQSKQASIIIDDKLITDLPGSCQGILLDRHQAEALVKNQDYWTINDLRIVKEFLL